MLLNKSKVEPKTTTCLVLHCFIKISYIWFEKKISTFQNQLWQLQGTQNTHLNETRHKNIISYTTAVSFNKKTVIFHHYLILLVLNLFPLFAFSHHLLLHQSISNKAIALSLNYLSNATNKPIPRGTYFPVNFVPKYIHNPSQSPDSDLARHRQTKLKHFYFCKSAFSFEPIAVNVNFTSAPVCQCINIVGSVFCQTLVFIFNPCSSCDSS